MTDNKIKNYSNVVKKIKDYYKKNGYNKKIKLIDNQEIFHIKTYLQIIKYYCC